MDTIIDAFHIDLKLFIAQIVNFAIVFGVLFFFVIKPLMKVMKERTEKIETGLKEAAAIKDKLRATEEDYSKEIKKARIEAMEIVKEANERAEKKRDEMIAKAKSEIAQIITKEKENIKAERINTMNELKSEVADLVMLSLEKVLGKKLEKGEDKELIVKMLKD